MQQLFIKWRYWKIDSNVTYPGFSLNGGYTLSFRYNASRKWYVDNAGVKILDDMIEGKYVDIGKVSTIPRKDKCFCVVEFDETKTTAADLSFDLTNDYSDYAVKVMTKLEAIDFLRDYTNCTETSMNVFELRPAYTDPISNVTTPAYSVNLN